MEAAAVDIMMVPGEQRRTAPNRRQWHRQRRQARQV